MRLIHISPCRIRAGRYLDPDYSRGRIRGVWLCLPSRARWAFVHVATHHQTVELYLHEVRVPKSLLTRRYRCVYTCAAKVRVESVRSIKI